MADTPWKDLVDCDVQDKERLALFRAKLREWRKCLDDDLEDPHSIVRQMIGLLWDDTVWRTFNEACRLSKQTNHPSTGLQGTLIRLLKNGFVTRQLMAIRRLTEQHQYNPKKAVYSIRSLLTDICDNRHLFTRENYVCYDGLSYEPVAGEDDDAQLKRDDRHFKYDILSGKTSIQRQRYDLVNDDFFAKINSCFGTFSNLETYVNNFVAHASHPNNRPDPDRTDAITIAYLDKCYHELIHIAKGIGILLDDFAKYEVPIPQYAQLKNWDKPIVTSEDKKKLCGYWSDREKEISKWNKDATKHYQPPKLPSE